MGFIETIVNFWPDIAPPKQKRLSFNEKLKWTLIFLVLFYVLGLVPLYGLGTNALQHFEFLSVILGASFGSIISLGIGPIVTASIVLQLLNGAGILKFDMESPEGKKKFTGVQKMFSLFFIILEAFIYVRLGGLSPSEGISMWVLVFQLCLGGVMILFMDEVIQKWGFGSGISLFIAAGVSQHLFIRLLSPLHPGDGETAFVGAIPDLFRAFGAGDVQTGLLHFVAIAATVGVFVLVVYTQSMKVEIPLSFGRVRGHGVRWPLNFFYTSNIPVILVAALIANIRLFARLLHGWIGPTFLGDFGPNGNPTGGLAAFLFSPNIIKEIIKGSFTWNLVLQAIIYVLIFIGGSVMFSWFWVQTANLDARSQAKQMLSSGLQIPGFRKDQRVLERMLNRYIGPLTVMGGMAVGLLAALADLSGALTSGTGLLLTVTIVYKLYEEIAQQHVMDMNPMMRKFMGK